MSRLGAAKKRARRGVVKDYRVDPEKALRRVRESVESSGEQIDGAAIERALFATPVPASQERRGRMLVVGMLLVACGLWWALALFEVLR